MSGRFHLADLFETVAHTAPDRLDGCKGSKPLIRLDEVRRSPAGKQDCHWARELAESAT